MWRITLMYLFFALRCVAGEAELPSSTKATMDAFTKSTDKLTMDYNKAMTDARTKAIVGLTKAQDVETKKGNLEGALAIRKKIEELVALDEEGTDLLGAPKNPTTVEATLFATGCNNIEVRVNGVSVVKANRDSVTNAQVTIKVGDVITVRNGDRHDVNSQFIMATTSDGAPLFWISKGWLSYLPPDVRAWSELMDKKFITKPSELAGIREYADMTDRNAATIPGWRKDMVAISGTLMAEDKATYMVYRVTAQDLIPKK
jgi:hypothetical protein